MTDSCICGGNDGTISLFSSVGKLLARFRSDCPKHGTTVLVDRPMHRVERIAWIRKDQAILYRGREGVRILARSPDREQAKITWVEWLTEEEYRDEQGTVGADSDDSGGTAGGGPGGPGDA